MLVFYPIFTCENKGVRTIGTGSVSSIDPFHGLDFRIVEIDRRESPNRLTIASNALRCKRLSNGLFIASAKVVGSPESTNIPLSFLPTINEWYNNTQAGQVSRIRMNNYLSLRCNVDRSITRWNRVTHSNSRVLYKRTEIAVVNVNEFLMLINLPEVRLYLL